MKAAVYSYLLTFRWSELRSSLGNRLRYFIGCIRGCWCLDFQDDERQHPPPTPSITRKHATATVMNAFLYFRHRTPLQVLALSYTYILNTPLNASVPPVASHLSGTGSLCRTSLTPASPIPPSQVSVRRRDPAFQPGMWLVGVYTVVTVCKLSLFSKSRKMRTIRFDSADKTESVKAGQSQKYLFTPMSAGPTRRGNTQQFFLVPTT